MTIPFFNNMECKLIIDGVHWFSGYVDSVPERDSEEPVMIMEGTGYVNKLHGKTINESYTSQTLDYIIKDIANTYLGTDLNVYVEERIDEYDSWAVGCSFFPYRDYMLFGLLAGVRGEEEAIFTPRGLPADKSSFVEAEYGDGSNWHDPSYLSVEELEVIINTYVKLCGHSVGGDILAIYGALKGYALDQMPTRLVFWFDS